MSVREDAETLLRAQELGRPSSRGRGVKDEGRREEKGMYESLSLHHLYTLLDCLLQAHRSCHKFLICWSIFLMQVCSKIQLWQ